MKIVNYVSVSYYQRVDKDVKETQGLCFFLIKTTWTRIATPKKLSSDASSEPMVCFMDGWVGGWMDGWMDGWADWL